MRSSSLVSACVFVKRTLCVIAVVCTGWICIGAAQAAPPVEEVYVPLLQKPAAANQPLDVVPQPDSGRAVSVTVPLAGGQVVATAANNTRFALTIPPNALVQTTTITLTPVASITGLPGIQLVGAVQIEPLNVLLLEAALLKIEPVQAVPVPQEYPFAYYGPGRDFHAFPILPKEKGLVYPLGQFYGSYGIAQTTVQAAGAMPDFTPAGAQARTAHRIATLIQLERERILQGQPEDPTVWPKIRQLALEYFNTSLKPMLPPSKADCGLAKATMPTAVGWLRSMTLLLGAAAETDPDYLAAEEEVWDALIAALQNCYYEAVAPCIDWDNEEQVDELLSHLRGLALLGAYETVTPPGDLPMCTYVEVRLQGGVFHYEWERAIGYLWDKTVYFQFVDDSVSSVGFYIPFLPKNTPLPGPTATISITALIDGVWQPIEYGKQFFCRDRKAERLQELMISLTGTEGEPELPPQLFADNIGCWRWSGTSLHDIDYDVLPTVPEYYQHTSGTVVLERDPNKPYAVYKSEGALHATPIEYRLVSPSVADYHEKLHQVDDKGNTTCMQTLDAHISNPWVYLSKNFSGIRLPNAGFGRPREVEMGSIVELKVDLPYTTQGHCPMEGTPLDRIALPVRGTLSANGKRIQLDETGQASVISDYRVVIDLQALREE